MILKKLELQGFKSFANKTVIEFEEGITAVVGPNGSGKSNISDSVRWVLGEQSAKTLRGDKMEDIIFNGTEEKSPLGFAEVTLTLNNETGMFPTEYEEVAVTRRVFRDGESEFYINKKACRLKDIRELFMDTGIGKDGYSIISQGRIDEILSTKSEDRRNIFEEAAGITKYKSRKQESERKLNRTKENLVRIEDIIMEIESQINPLKEQAVKAERFIEVSSSLRGSEVELLSNQIRKYKEKDEEIDQKIAILEEKRREALDSEERLDIRSEELKFSLNETESSLNDENEYRFSVLSRRDKLKSDIYLYNQKNENNRRYKKRTELDIADIDVQSEELTISVEDKKKCKVTIESELASRKTELNEKKDKIDSINSEIIEFEDLHEKKKAELIENLNRNSEHKLNISNIDSHISMFDSRKSRIDSNYSDIMKNSDDINNLLSKIEKEAEIKKDEISSLKNRIESLKQSIETAQNTNKNNQIEFENIRNSSERKISSYNILKDMQEDYEGYYKGVRNFLNRVKHTELKEGVEGVVAELLNVDEKYEKAIEVALGGSLQNIVTQDTVYAKKSIEFLKQYKLGRITFLPLDNIKGRYLNDREKMILSENGVIGVASDIVQYDEKYKQIFEYILGRTIIVDHIDNMIRISKKFSNSFRIVTLDGDIMNPGGSMTGGNFRGNTLSLLGRGRQIEELKKEIIELKSRYNELSEILKESGKLINAQREELSSYESDFNGLILEQNDIRNRLLSAKSKEESIVLQRKEFDQEVEQIKQEKEKLNAQREALMDSMEIILKENEKLTLANREDSEKLVKMKEQLEKMREEYVSRQIDIASTEENLKSLILSIDNEESDIEKLNDRKKDFLKRIEEIINEISDTEKDIINTEQSIAEAEVVLKDCDEKINNFRLSKEKLTAELSKIDSDRNEIIKEKDSLIEKLNKFNIDKERNYLKLESIKSKLWEEYEMSLIMAEQCEKSGKTDVELKEEVAKAKREIKAIGNVNLDSIEELKQITERFEFMSKQRDDLIEAEKSLKYVIKEMNSKMKEQFIKKFSVIREEFKTVFTELFNGGKADIYIEDESDILNSGIDIVAEPPGKKLQNLSLLSGGERALTAISLLFAILKTKPTPFSILDEIEAALDEANVYRYADYLKKFSEESQFVVVTHRKGTMEAADSIYGVTMQRNGISELISLKLTDIEN